MTSKNNELYASALEITCPHCQESIPVTLRLETKDQIEQIVNRSPRGKKLS